MPQTEKAAGKKRKTPTESHEESKSAPTKPKSSDKKQKGEDGSSNGTMVSASFFTGEPFNSLPVSDELKKALNSLGFEKMTQIQSLSIPPLLAGKDVVGAAKTGSGKTLVSLGLWLHT